MEAQERFWNEAHGDSDAKKADIGVPVARIYPDDWILSSSQTVNIFEKLILTSWQKVVGDIKPIKVLVAGCGTSDLSVDLFNKYPNILDITSIDISDVAISSMKHKHPKMKFLKVDCCKLKEYFKDEKFNVVIDKGTADTLLFRIKRSKSRDKICQYFDGVKHLLHENGHFIVITPRKKMYKLSEMFAFTTQKIENKIEKINMLVKKRKTKVLSKEQQVENDMDINRSVYVHHCLNIISIESKANNNNKKKVQNEKKMKIKKMQKIENEMIRSINKRDYINDDDCDCNDKMLTDEATYLQSIYKTFCIKPNKKEISTNLRNENIRKLFHIYQGLRENKEYEISDTLRLYLKLKYNMTIENHGRTSIIFSTSKKI
eukprot:g5480.t1